MTRGGIMRDSRCERSLPTAPAAGPTGPLVLALQPEEGTRTSGSL
jgi:hypothetical protein